MPLCRFIAVFALVFSLLFPVAAGELIELPPQSVRLDAQQRVVATIDWGRLVVRGHDGSELVVVARIEGPDRDAPADFAALAAVHLRQFPDRVEVVPELRYEGFVGVELEIKVPRGRHLELGIRRGGEIDVRGVGGSVEIDSRNGSIELEDLVSPILVTAENGSIEAGFARFDSPSPSVLSSHNGSVELELPSDSAFELRARLRTGELRSDFELQNLREDRHFAEALRELAPRSFRAEVGAGGPELMLFSANGSIVIDRAVR